MASVILILRGDEMMTEEEKRKMKEDLIPIISTVIERHPAGWWSPLLADLFVEVIDYLGLEKRSINPSS